jgi:hypothetical protein
MKKLLLLLLLFSFSCVQEDVNIELSETQEINVFNIEGTWILKNFKSQAIVIYAAPNMLQGSMFIIPIDFYNHDDWSVLDATGEYDWFIETINNQRILTVEGGGFGTGELVVQNEGDFCNEEWYSLAISDATYERVDDSCN